MKHPLIRGLIGSLLVLSCSIALAGQAALELVQGEPEKLSGYSSIGAISAESVYAADQADPNAVSDSESASVDNSESAAVAESPEAMAVWVTIQGTVRNDLGSLVCAMALANGQYMFTCNPLGSYSLTLPLNSDGQIDLQVFAAGHMPFRMKLPGNQGFYGVILEIAEDCSPPTEYCGNGSCGVGETYINCPQDCSAPPPTEYCGNGSCGIGEDYINCPQDCKPPAEYCGNGSCGIGETYINCPQDCNPPAEYCGNGSCGIGEDYINCPQDCTAPSTSNLTVTMIDKCSDGRNIDYKHYDPINNWVWPSSTTHWATPGYDLQSTHTLKCQNSGKVCFGGRAGTRYWGVDVDGSKSCTGCCMPCENKSWTWNLTCN